MTLTPEERAEINRRNAQKSTGPTSVEGKARSRGNALKHGLRAEALALPNEDPEAAAARSAAWNDYYQPESPAAQHLVNECVQATLLSERCHTYHHAVLTRQIREAEESWDNVREDEIAALQELLLTDQATAVRHLKRSREGLRWLIEQWELLQASFKETGAPSRTARKLALRLLGYSADASLADESDANWLNVTVEQLAELQPRAAHYEATIDGPDRAEAAARALLPQDPITAKLFLRYQAEARTSFHRAYNTLLKTLERDAAEGPAPVVAEAEAEVAAVAIPEAVEPVSPNEASPAAPEAPEPPKTPVANPPAPPISAAADTFQKPTRAEERRVMVRSS